MRRALNPLGLLLAIGFASARAYAADPTDSDTTETQHNTEQPKEGEQPAPVLEPGAATGTPAATAVAPPSATLPPPARPKVGDVSITGYLRGGFGATIPLGTGMNKVGGRQVCFSLSNPSGLVAKYRLGNECEIWSETHFTMVTYVGEDGAVSTLHFMPTVFIPTTNIGYSPNATVNSPALYTTSTGATVSFPNLYIDLKGVPWLGGGTAWAGTRYYKRESVYINDFFYWNPSGVGAGVEDINLPYGLRLSVGLFAVDGEPQLPDVSTSPQLPLQVDFGVRGDFQLRGIKPWEGGEIQLGFQYILDASNHPDPNTGVSVTSGGWGGTFQFVQNLLGGNNKLAVQYGKGGGTGFGTLSRFYYPDFSLYFNPIQYRIRALDVVTVQPLEWLGGQAVLIYQRDQNFLGVQGENTTWWSAGGRVSAAANEHFKLVGEVGFDRITKSISPDVQQLMKFTLAPTLSGGKGLMSRPELRAFVTYAQWNEPARGANIDSGQIYRSTNLLGGYTAGLQAETWY